MPSINNLADFGSFLRSYRRERKLSQAELASRLGYNQATISYYESGKARPTVTTPFYQDVVNLVGNGAAVPPIADPVKLLQPVSVVQDLPSQKQILIPTPDAAIAAMNRLDKRL